MVFVTITRKAFVGVLARSVGGEKNGVTNLFLGPAGGCRLWSFEDR
jgi:hypothetical protein